MKQEVLITVRGEQYYEGVDPDQTELVTEGTMEPLPDGWRLEYDESEMTGMAGTHTTIDLHETSALLMRRGTLTSMMAFEVGKPHTSFYETPAGTLTVDLHTKSVKIRMGESGGIAEIRYAILVEHELMGNNSFKLRVKTKARGTVQ